MRRLMVFLACVAACGCALSFPAPDMDPLNGMAAVVLERRDRDPQTSSMIDGIVFFPPSPWRYVRRRNGDHVILLDAPGGSAPAPVSAANRESYRALIARNSLSRREAGKGVLVYCPEKTTFVFTGDRSGGGILIEVRDRLQPENAAPEIGGLIGRR